MPLKTLAGRLAIDELLPDEYKDPRRVLNKGAVSELLAKISGSHPELYGSIASKLARLGAESAFRAGGNSFDLEHLRKPAAAKAVQDAVRLDLKRILNDDTLDDAGRQAAILAAVEPRHKGLIDDTMKEAIGAGNPFARQVKAGIRGNPMHLARLLAGDLLYGDHEGRAIPLPVLRSYSQNLSPAEYFAGAFGARQGVIATKFCLAGWMKIRMADGTVKQIDAIVEGDIVTGVAIRKDGTLRTAPSKVVRTYNNGLKPCRRYFAAKTAKSPMGPSVVCTSDHYIGLPDGSAAPAARVVADGLPVVVFRDGEPADRFLFVAGPEQLVATCDIEIDNKTHLFLLENGLAVSNSTADAGFLLKQLAQTQHRLVATDQDDDREPSADRGLPVQADDPDNEGALLAKGYGPFGRNTPLTPRIMRKLTEMGHSRILIRSPMVGGPPDGGIYSRDAGIRSHGGLAARGDAVGMENAGSIGEPITQGSLCLAAGTKVRMSDNTVRRIEEVRVFEWVTGADKDGNLFPVQVLRTYCNGVRDCDDFEWPGARLTATLDHKILSTGYPGGKVAIRPLRLAHEAFLADGRLARIDKSSLPASPLMTFDIEIDHPDHLFVLACGAIVSNSSKHGGGVAGQGGVVSGFARINAEVQIPKTLKGGAVHADEDGTVSSIEPAPAGGFLVRVGEAEHYVPVDRELAVKVGDTVEAGDVMTDGLPQAWKVVEHKGIGEGRRYFAKTFRDSVKAAGGRVDRRNTEMLARGLINHVRLTGEMGERVPDDIVPYQTIEYTHEPREGTKRMKIGESRNKYLERPVLHYSLGTKIRPSVIKELHDNDIREVEAHDEPPPFKPLMVRAMDQMAEDPDWLTNMYGSGLKSSFLDAVHTGRTTDPEGTSFVPGLATGKDFGRKGVLSSTPKPPEWKPMELPKIAEKTARYNEFGQYKCPKCGGRLLDGEPKGGARFRGSGACLDCGHVMSLVGERRNGAIERTGTYCTNEDGSEKKAKEDTRPYRDRVEMYPVDAEGRIFGGVYPDGGFGAYGGGVDEGEDPATAAAREFLEESGRAVSNPKLLDIPPHVVDWKPPYASPKQEERAKTYRGSRTFYAYGDLGDPVPGAVKDKSGLTAARAYTMDEAEKLLAAEQSDPVLAAANANRRKVIAKLRELRTPTLDKVAADLRAVRSKLTGQPEAET